jgi:hypothetical protein
MSCLNITVEQFRSIYEGTPILEYEHIFYTDVENAKDLITNRLASKLWRLNNLYTIVDKFGKNITFRMNMSQHKVYAKSVKHKRIIILKSRQQGISTLWLVSFFDDAITNSNFSIGLMAQGQDEAATLLVRTKILWDNLDQDIKDVFNVRVTTNNTKEFSFNNGSTILIRTSFRSATLQRLHISEMGKIANKYPEKAREVKTGTLQAIAPGNTAVIESTAEGANMFKEMWITAMKASDDEITGKDFMPVFLSWLDDPDCALDKYQEPTTTSTKYFRDLAEAGVEVTQEQQNWWITQYRELGDAIFQEYPATDVEAFLVSKDGTFYAKLYINFVLRNKRAVTGLYDENLEVQCAVDIGMDDTNVLVFFQTWLNAQRVEEIRIIAEYRNSGEDIEHYTDHIKSLPFTTDYLILPHDAKVREHTSGLTREDVYRRNLPGVEVTVLENKGETGKSRREGIEMVRQAIKNLWIDKACTYLIDCLYNYSKEWNTKLNRWADSPLHDEYSNGADALRYMCVGKRFRKKEYSQRKRSNSGFDV